MTEDKLPSRSYLEGGYIYDDEVEDFDPFENPLDKFHTRICLLPSMVLVIKISLLLQDLHVHII
ncbi:hypothetical protein MTR_1g115935 [Medicago truncatula]|uniref:Uncharacterized protein n=1 Tax=Medicago truncatula TaxID=3880 RepID=A0A072VS67_MEDTR|nr:hypothetical protein MTR_1g115935 [Medicago truncatula]